MVAQSPETKDIIDQVFGRVFNVALRIGVLVGVGALFISEFASFLPESFDELGSSSPLDSEL